MAEYERGTTKTSSGVAKAAIAIGSTALGLNLLGANGTNLLGNSNGVDTAVFNRGAYAYGNPTVVGFEVSQQISKDYVSNKEMCLIRENSTQGSTIARLEAEKYSDNKLVAAVAPLDARLCEVEAQIRVNAARDTDFRRYVNTEFVHQPKAYMNEMIVTCQKCGCNNGSCGCNRGGFDRFDGRRRGFDRFDDGCCD